MDLLSEASSGARALSARHISVDKSLPDEDKAVNTTLLCHTYSLQPDIGSYLAALDWYAWVLWPCALAVLLASCVLYGVTVRAALKHWRGCATNAAIVLAVYPVVTAAAFIVLIVPRARLLSEAISQQIVMTAMYHLYRMILAECGGREKLIRCAGEARVETRVLPCCCWPCCPIPRPKLNERSLSSLRYLVLQMAVVQGLLYIIMLILWAEDMMLYVRSFIYIQPFVVASILFGVWAIIMCVRVAEAAGRSPRPRFLALQLALIIVKLQCGAAKILPEMFTLPCIMPLHPSVVVNMIQNALMMVEMLVLSLWAWRLYRVPPGAATGGKVIVVAVVDDASACADVKAIKDDDKSINNNSESNNSK